MMNKQTEKWLRRVKTTFMGLAMAVMPSLAQKAPSSQSNGMQAHPRTETAQHTLNTPTTNSPKMLFIGDSRTVGMFTAVTNTYKNPVNTTDQNGNLWFAKVGEDLKWFQKNETIIQEKIQDCDCIIINLGVNDITKNGGNGKKVAEKFCTYFNKMAPQWTAQGKKVYIGSCNPVGKNFTAIRNMNAQIDAFNQTLLEGLSKDITFIDVNSFVKNHVKDRDFRPDGLHYQTSMNSPIYQNIFQQVSEHSALLAQQKEQPAPENSQEKKDIAFASLLKDIKPLTQTTTLDITPILTQETQNRLRAQKVARQKNTPATPTLPPKKISFIPPKRNQHEV